MNIILDKIYCDRCIKITSCIPIESRSVIIYLCLSCLESLAQELRYYTNTLAIQSQKKNKLYPTHYTSRDGSYWMVWPKHLPLYEEDLDRMRLFAQATGRRTAKLGKVTFHSLDFKNIIPNNGSVRWDVINGWNSMRGE